MRDRRGLRVYPRILLRRSDPAYGPAAVIRIGVIHRIIDNARDIHGGAKKSRLIRDGDQREKSAIAQTPHPDAIWIDVRQGLKKIAGHPCILGILAADVHINAVAPGAAIADAAPVIGREYDIAFLQKILMKAVIYGIITLHVPAVVILVDSVAVNPNDRCMLLAAIEIFGNEQPAGNGLSIGSGEMHVLRLD